MTEPWQEPEFIRVGGQYSQCTGCGETYHSTLRHECLREDGRRLLDALRCDHCGYYPPYHSFNCKGLE